MPLKVQTVQTGLEASIRKAVSSVNRRGGLNLSVNDKQFTRPLGKITGSVSEFNKSLDASNARVLAFGASVGIIQGVQRAFSALIKSTVEVERKLAEINVVMGVTNKELDEMSRGLFKVAKNTAQSFSTVATAATELARQGLSMEETLKRTNDALILTRLTGLDAANAVSGLTAAINTFNKAGLDSTKILSKMAAVDVQFAVSTEDLIDGIARAGAVAQDAGVSFDQLLGAVTAAQQQTARGGKVIGNSFKTIFTRVQRASTIQRLEELGIAVRDIAGNTLPAIRVLENLSKTYDTLADTTKAAVAEQVGGVFQINILKAAIKDLSEENSILARATKIASQATDEAYRKNALLNQTIAALTSQTVTSIEQLGAVMGKLAFDEPIRFFLNIIKDGFGNAAEFLSAGEGFGADIGRGLIKGIGNVLAGPVMLSFLGVLVKLFGKTFSFLAGSMKELLGITTVAQKQKEIQKTIVAVLSENSALQQKILSQEGNRAAQEKTILGILRAQSMEQQKIAAAAAAIGPAVMRAGFNQNLKRTRSEGHIPNFNLVKGYPSKEEASAERAGAKSAGYNPGAVKSMNMPGQGRVVYNTAESVRAFPGMKQPAIMPPKRSNAGKNYTKAFKKVHGFNPYANQGHIPNYAAMRYSPESAANIARGLIYGGKTAMGLQVAPNKQLKDTWHSYGPAMATGTEMNSIREKIYKNFIVGKGDQMRHDVNAALRNFGANVPKSWGGSGDLVYGMVESLNGARRSSRKLPMPYSGGYVPNYASARIPAKYKTQVRDDGPSEYGPPKQVYFESSVGGKNFATSHVIDIADFKDPNKRALQVIMTSEANPSLRGKGYGKDLYEHMAEYSRKNGYTGLYGDIGTSISAMRVVDSIAKGKKFKVEKAGDLQFRKDIGEKNGMWGGENYTYKISNQGHVPNYGLGNLFRRQKPKTSDRDFLGKGLGAAGKLISTPFKDIGSLLKGGYNIADKGGDLIRRGIIGTAKGGYNAYTNIFEAGKHGLGKGFDLMKKFPRATLYGGGGGLGYKFQDQIMGAVGKYGPKALEMGGKLGKGVLDVFQNPTSHIDLISAVLGGALPASVLGLTLADDILRMNKTRKDNKVGSDLKAKGKHRGNLRIRDLPDDLQKVAIGMLRVKGGPNNFGSANNVPKAMLEKIGMSGGHIPNFARRGKGLPSQMNSDDKAMNTWLDEMNASLRNPGPKKYFTPKVSSGRSVGKRFRDLSPSMMEKAAMMYWKSGYMKPDRPIPPHLFPHTLIPKNMFGSLRIDKPGKWDMSTSEGFVPNFGMRLNANKIKSIGQGKIHSNKFDDTIGMKELDNILTTGLFKSLNYTSKAGNDLTYKNARWGVNKYKKGAPPPGNYVSYGEMDKATGTRSMWIGSTGEGADAFRKLKLNRIQSVVSQGKHLKVDPNMANSGFVPNYSAFHYDKNLPMSMPRTGDRISFLKALEFMPEQKLKQAMKMYVKEGIFDFKGSYPGMSMKDFQSNFPKGSSNTLGLDYLSNKRQGEILQNPDVMKSFFRYITGKSTSIGIESALTADEKKHFMSKHGMIPRVKSIDDGLIPGQKKKDRLSLIREDFLTAGASSPGSKSGSVQGYIQKAFKQTRGSGHVLDPSFRMNIPMAHLIRQNEAMAPKIPLGLPFDPERNLSNLDKRKRLFHNLSRSNPDVLTALSRLGNPGNPRAPGGSGGLALGSQYIDKDGNLKTVNNKFGATSGRFRGDEAITRRAVDSGLLRDIIGINQGASFGNSTGMSARDAVLGSALGKGGIASIKAQDLMEKENYSARRAATLAGVESDRINKIYKDLFEKKKQTGAPRGSGFDRNLFSQPLSARTRRKFGLKGDGHIPNYSLFGPGARDVLSTKPEFTNAVSNAVSREASFGVTPKVVTAPSLKSLTNPGLAVVNNEQEGGKLANARKLHGRLNPRQGSSKGVIPNYATPLTAQDFLANKRMAYKTNESMGLKSMEKSFYNASQAIDAATASSKKLKAEMQKAAISFGNTAKSAKEAEVRTQSSRGNLSDRNKGFARQLFRNDAAQAMMKDSRVGPLMSSVMSGGKLNEDMLKEKMVTAKASGDNTTLRALQNLNKTLDKSAKASMNSPKFLGQQLGSGIANQAAMNKVSDRVFGTKGYSKSDLNKVFLRDYLGQKGVNTEGMGTKAMNSVMMAGGRGAASDFSKFAASAGVTSSSGVLARGGLMKGEFGKLTTDQKGVRTTSTGFTRDLKSLEKAVADGNKKQIKSLTKGLQKEAARIAANPAAFKRLEAVRKEVVNAAQQQRAQPSGFAAKAQSHLARGNNIRAGFFGGMSGQGGMGSGIANRAGGLVTRGKGALGSFGKMGGMGGQLGLGLSFALPMLAGMVSPTRARDERATFNQQSGNFEITEGGDKERMSSTMMGAGIGALFGLPGMLVGAAIGFVSSSKKMTLSIDEIVQKQEKQLQLLSRSVQAGTQLEGLMGTRATAFGQGDEQGLKRIDAAINATLGQIADVEVFDEMSNAMGNADAMKNLNKRLQDRLSIDASIQNFSVATKNKDSKSQGLAFGNIVAQQISSGLLKEDKFKDAIAGIRNQRKELSSKGLLRTPEELEGIKRRASGDVGTFEGLGGWGLGIGAGIGLAVVGALAAIPTFGASLGLTAVGATMAAGASAGYAVGQYGEQEIAKTELEIIRDQEADAAQHLGKLAEAAALTDRQFQSLIAAYNKGDQSFDALLKSTEKTVEANLKMRKESEKLSGRIFNLDKAFATTIANLKQEAQIKSIRSAGVGQRQNSAIRFSSQFSGFQGSDIQKRMSRRTISSTEALRSSQIEANDLNSRAGFATKFQQKLKGTNLQITQQAAILNKVATEGFQVLRDQLNSGKITGTMDILGGAETPEARLEQINKMRKSFIGTPNGIRNNLKNRDDMSELRDLVALSDEQINKLTIKLADAAKAGVGGKFAQGAEFNLDFEKQTDDATIKVIQDIISVIDRQKELELEKIKVQQEALILQESQNIISARINELMTTQSMRMSFNASKEDNTIARAQAKSKLTQANLNFEKDGIFRSGSTRQENRRQTDIQEKIFKEQESIQGKELAARAKMEIRRLLSDQKVIFALNNLGSAVKDLLEPLTGKNPPNLDKKINLGLNETGLLKKKEAISKRTNIQKELNSSQKKANDTGSRKQFLGDMLNVDKQAFAKAEERYEAGKGQAIGPRRVTDLKTEMDKAEKDLKNTQAKLNASRVIDTSAREEVLRNKKKLRDAQKQVERVSTDPANQKVITLKDVQAEVDKVTREMMNPNGGINFKSTDAFAGKVEAISLDSMGLENSKNKLKELKTMSAKGGDSGEQLELQIDTAIEGIEALIIAEDAFKKANNLTLKNTNLKNKVADFRVMSGSRGSINRLNDLRDMDNVSAGRISSIDRIAKQAEAEKAFKVLQNDPGASRLEVQNARLAAGRQSIGTVKQRSSLIQMNKDFVSETKNFSDSAIGSEERRKAAEAMVSLEEQIVELTGQMERVTPRDGGFGNEFRTNMNLGLGQGFAALDSQAESIYVKLGQDLPFAFRDGLTSAMTLALNKADDLSGKIKEIGISLLQMVQQAFLQSASSRLVGGMQGLFGLGKAEGGYVSGGSGVRDDVPAMLMGGEYVIKKSAVQRYGSDFLNKLNNGEISGYAKGGPVSLSMSSPRAAVREAVVDESKYGDITTYKTKSADTGMDSRLSGYARANDRTIQEYFDEQENQFRQDLQTVKQRKSRDENYQRARTQKRKAWQGALLGIAGGVALSKGMDWYKNTDFSKSRARKGVTSQMDKKGFVNTKGNSIGKVYQNPDDVYSAKSFINRMAKQNPTQAAIAAQESGIKTSISKSGRVIYNSSGGKVPAMLQGGEYVMNPSAVNKYGSSTMSKINNGTLNTGSSGSSAQGVNNNNEVNINVNVDSSGSAKTSSGGSSPENPKKFAEKVKAAVLQVIQQEKRVGGSLR